MTVIVHPSVEQRSDEWYELRRGIVTASAVRQLVTARKLSAIDYQCPDCGAAANDPCTGKRKPFAPIKTLHPERAKYAKAQPNSSVVEAASNDDSRDLTALLAAERITGWVEETPISDAMWRGIEDEPRAREAYALNYAPVTEVGFITNDTWGPRIGYSPDGLVGDDGLIEIKSRTPKRHVQTVLSGAVPPEVMPQLQCGLLVSGRSWIDYISFCGGMPLWPKRVWPDRRWFDAIITATRQFEANATEMIRLYHEETAGLPMTERAPQEIVI